jgi:hypothetical protein
MWFGPSFKLVRDIAAVGHRDRVAQRCETVTGGKVSKATRKASAGSILVRH